MLLLIHCLLFLIACGGSVFGICFVMMELVSCLVLQSAW